AARPAGSLRPEFVGREFAVAVLVELLEGCAGLGDFVSVNDPVFVQVESLDDGIHRTLTAHAATGAARTAAALSIGSARAAFTARRTLPAAGWVSVLRIEQA